MKGKSRAMKEQICRMHAEGHKIKKISCALSISKNTVRKYLRSASESSPDASVEPDGSVREDRSPKIDWDYVLTQVSLGRTLKVIYEETQPATSYSNFTRLIKVRLPKSVPITAVRLHHEPGERVQVDYCDGIKLFDPITGQTTKTQFFCGVLPSSSYLFGEFTQSQKSSDFLRSHERMWHYFGGVPKYVVVDNLKSGVLKAHRYDPDINPVYCDFANHCGFAVLPARVRTPRDKACVESTIGVVQRGFFEKYRNHKFYSLNELNTVFRAYLDDLNGRIMSDYGVSRVARFALEKPLLGPLPASKYEFFEWKMAKVHPDCCIELLTSVYSVPFVHVGKSVRVKFSDQIVIILDETGLETLAVHSRAKKYKPSIVEDHLPPNKIQRECFDIKRVEAIAKSIGPKTTSYVDWQLSSDKYPLQVLRRMQGLVRFYQNSGVNKDAMEFAATRSLDFNQRKLRYFTSCAETFKPGQTNLILVNPPKREMANIHLQKQEQQ